MGYSFLQTGIRSQADNRKQFYKGGPPTMNRKAAQFLAVMLTVPEFAEQLGLKEATVRAWILRRRISYCKINGKSVRIPRSELDRLTTENFVPALMEAE